MTLPWRSSEDSREDNINMSEERAGGAQSHLWGSRAGRMYLLYKVGDSTWSREAARGENLLTKFAGAAPQIG